jgi:MoaA/NifB/PqqE/SkfB family radical SAM enzyme
VRSAGLLLTYRCSAACEFCYYHCSPEKGGLLPVETCLAAWRSLKDLAGDAAKVHLTGGEPFLCWDRLVEILAEGRRQKLGPVDLVETNGSWATEETLVRDRLRILLDLDVHRLKISVDPFHQEYVDIRSLRLLATAAKELFGAERVLVRWEEYLGDRVSGAAASEACRW